MTDRISTYLTLLLVLSGLIMVGITVLLRPAEQQPPAAPALTVAVDESINVPELASSLSEGEADWGDGTIVAVFILQDLPCPPCLNEVFEYAALLDSLDAAHGGVSSMGVVFEPDLKKAARFTSLMNFPMPMVYGLSEELLNRLIRWEDGTPVPQLAFIEIKEKRVFYRARLLNAPTTTQYKRAVLSQMQIARHPQHQTTP